MQAGTPEQKTVGDTGLSRPVAKGLRKLDAGDDKRRPYNVPSRIAREAWRGELHALGITYFARFHVLKAWFDRISCS